MASSTPPHYRRISAEWFIHLPPAYLATPADGAHAFLARYLMRHLPELGGILVGYEGMQPVDDAARIYYDNGYFHFTVKVDLLVFSPKVGSAIVGTVTKTSRSHIGLLVHDVFNASIPSDLAGTFFSYDETQRLWVEYGTGKQLEEGSVLRFKVHALENANDMMAIVGSLQTAGEKLGLVGQRPKPSIPHAPELAPLYEASPSKMAKQFVDELKRKREEEGEGGDDDERDTLFEGNATLKKKRKQDKGSAAETAGAIEAPGEAADGTPGSPPAPKPKDKHRDPSTLSARDLKKLQRKKDRKKEKAAE